MAYRVGRFVRDNKPITLSLFNLYTLYILGIVGPSAKPAISALLGVDRAGRFCQRTFGPSDIPLLSSLFSPSLRLSLCALQKVGNHVSLMFEQQQKALGRIKERVELVYRNGDFTDREKTTQCCHVTNLTDSQEFGLPVGYRVLYTEN